MRRRLRGVAAAAAIITAATLVIRADVTPSSQSVGDPAPARRPAVRRGAVSARRTTPTSTRSRAPTARSCARPARASSSRRCGSPSSTTARHEAELLAQAEPRSPDALSLYGDALWSSGLFPEAEHEYQQALAIEPHDARALHGLARMLLARSQLDRAMVEAQEALRLSPRDLEIHHTVGAIYERMHKYEEAAAAYGNYVNLLPNKDTSDKAAWSRAEIRFLRSFGQRVPFEMDPGADQMLYTVPFKLVNEKVVVSAKLNDSSPQDFIVDTGSENTVVSRQTASRLGISPITYTLSAGVGEVGLRGLQLARIDSFEIGTLKLRNVPCLIKNPPLRDIPVKESESFSPLALGFSMTIDYKTHMLTIGRHLPDGAGGLRAAAVALPPGDGARRRRPDRTRRTSSSTPAAR